MALIDPGVLAKISVNSFLGVFCVSRAVFSPIALFVTTRRRDSCSCDGYRFRGGQQR